MIVELKSITPPAPPKPFRKPISPSTFAERLNLTTQTIVKKINAGEIKAMKIAAKCWRIAEDEFDNYVERITQ